MGCAGSSRGGSGRPTKMSGRSMRPPARCPTAGRAGRAGKNSRWCSPTMWKGSGLEKCRQLMELERNWVSAPRLISFPKANIEFRANCAKNWCKTVLRSACMICGTMENFTGSGRSFPKTPGASTTILQEWGASGFRSGFMLHNRECLQRTGHRIRRLDLRHRSI